MERYVCLSKPSKRDKSERRDARIGPLLPDDANVNQHSISFKLAACGSAGAKSS